MFVPLALLVPFVIAIITVSLRRPPAVVWSLWGALAFLVSIEFVRGNFWIGDQGTQWLNLLVVWAIWCLGTSMFIRQVRLRLSRSPRWTFLISCLSITIVALPIITLAAMAINPDLFSTSKF